MDKQNLKAANTKPKVASENPAKQNKVEKKSVAKSKKLTTAVKAENKQPVADRHPKTIATKTTQTEEKQTVGDKNKQSKTIAADEKKAQTEEKQPVADKNKQSKNVATEEKQSVRAKEEKTSVSKGNKQKNAEKQAKKAAKRERFSKNANKVVFDDVKKKDLWTVVPVAVFLCLILTVVPICLTFFVFGYPKSAFAQDYPVVTKVGYEAEILGEAERVKPVSEMRNGGLAEYPTYGYTLSSVIGTAQEKVDARNALIAESWKLCTVNTRIGTDGYPKNTYNRMDKNGNLFLNENPYVDDHDNPIQIYKHTAAEGMYLGDVSDSEKGVIKRITMGARGYTRGYSITGLYAPAGEVIKVEISEADMTAAGNGFTVYIGQALYNAKANNIWVAKNAMNRMPVILNTWWIDKNTAEFDAEKGVYVAYIGSFLGGPIYIANEVKTFSVTISRAVEYSHFILGYTTPQEFERTSASSAPYFDLEVWENGVLHSGPKRFAESFSYDQLYAAAVLWDKIALISTQVSAQGIVFLYDPFVAAGAAVAFPGQGSVNCPMGWMSSSLNYQSFVKGGAWGNMHEYNHNFQSGWGRGSGGEVTNNALNLVEYSLFTKISSSRKIGNYGAEGLSGWNRYTTAAWSLSQTLSDHREYDLSPYATILHSFGQEVFMNAIKKQRSGGYGQSMTSWCRAISEVTGMDLTYFYNNLVPGYSITSDWTEKIKSWNFPTYVPVASVYQTGASFLHNGEKTYFETMQPYNIKYGEKFVVDLNKYEFTKDNNGNSTGQYKSGSIVIPEGFSYKIKKITKPKYGSLKKTAENIYTYTPDRGHLRSGKIYVTLEITKDDGSFEVEDVDLVLEFEQSYEMNKNILERKVYTSTESGHLYETAAQAYENNFENYTLTYEGDNVNTAQNGNTEIWGLHEDGLNTMKVVSGKLYVASDGDYRISVRGRTSVAVYMTVVSKNERRNGKTYKIEINKDTGSAINNANFRGQVSSDDYYNYVHNENQKDYSVDIPDLQTGDWIKFDAVVRVTQNNSFVGLCWGKWEAPKGTYKTVLEPDGTKVDKYVPDSDAANYRLVSAENEDPVYKYMRGGQHVQSPEYSNAQNHTVTTAYANAYRNSYEFEGSFISDYFYTRQYFTSVENTFSNFEKAKILSENPCREDVNVDYSIENIIDEDNTNAFFSKELVTEKPVDIVVDLGKFISANRCVIKGFNSGSAWHTPNTFKFYVGSSKDDLKLIDNIKNGAVDGNGVFEFAFDKTQTFKVYRIVITGTNRNMYVAFSYINFKYVASQGEILSPDDARFKFKGNWTLSPQLSSFGHLYKGKNASMSFEFVGTQFAIRSASAEKANDFEVLIDDVRVSSLQFLDEGEEVYISYLSKELSNGKHKVVIRSKNAFNIDSIMLWETK